MKKLLLLMSVALCASNVNAQWQTDGPYWGSGSFTLQIGSLATNGSNILAGMGPNYGNNIPYSAYASTNNGSSWAAASTGLMGSITSFATIGSNIFAGTYGFGVYLSNDNGDSWTPVNSGITYAEVTSLLTIGNNIYAGIKGAGGGIVLSKDNGNSWAGDNLILNTPIVYSLAAISETNVFAGTDEGLYVSTSDGNWTAVKGGLNTNLDVYSLAIRDSIIFAGTNKGIYVSTDNGITWKLANIGIPTNDVINSFAINDSSIFAGTNGSGVFLSTNNGGYWTTVNKGLPDTDFYITALAISDTTIFAGTYGGVWQESLSEITTGIQKSSVAPQTSLILYPNPSSGQFTIKLQDDQNDCWIDVYNVMGEKIYESVLNNSQNIINLSSQPAGMYFYTLFSNGNQITTGKLLLE